MDQPKLSIHEGEVYKQAFPSGWPYPATTDTISQVSDSSVHTGAF